MNPTYVALVKPLSEPICTVLRPSTFHALRMVSEHDREVAHGDKDHGKVCPHRGVEIIAGQALCLTCHSNLGRLV